MAAAPARRHFPLADAMRAPLAPDNLAAEIAHLESLDIEFYSPHAADSQEPHLRDELYVIATGTDVLTIDNEDHPFVPGDVFYVPALAQHRFSEFSEGFATWVIFYGPEHGRNV